jgi:hypothetical protein
MWLDSRLVVQNCGRKGLVALSERRLRGVLSAASCFLRSSMSGHARNLPLKCSLKANSGHADLIDNFVDLGEERW